MALIPGTLPANTKYPNEPQALLDTFAAYMTAPEVRKNRPIVTNYTPAGSQVLNFNTAKVEETMFLNHSGTIAGLTLGFPSDGNSVIGQVIRVLPRSAVSATVSYSLSATYYGVTPQPTAFVAGTPYAWVKVASNTWFRIQ